MFDRVSPGYAKPSVEAIRALAESPLRIRNRVNQTLATGYDKISLEAAHPEEWIIWPVMIHVK